jgi:hypothetical protein
MDLLRLAGAPGVGKTTTAWALARRLAADGVPSGFVDIDQLGMCYPPPDGDPDRWALKERALAAVASEFARAGVARLVVSGVAWPDEPPPEIDGISVQSIWLDASEGTRRERLGVRQISDDQLAQSLSAGTAEAARVHAAWERLNTEQRSSAETVEDVLATWRALGLRRDGRDGAGSPAVPATDSETGEVLWITGPRLVGTSRVGWEVAQQDWQAGRRVGFVDLAQLSFAWNIHAPVGPANLARVHDTFRAAGAGRLVVVAPFEVDPQAAREALRASEVVFVRLCAPESDRRAHAFFRRSGGGPTLAGDDILEASDAEIDRIIRVSSPQSTAPLRDHESSIDVAGLPPVDAVAAVRREAGW